MKKVCILSKQPIAITNERKIHKDQLINDKEMKYLS